MSQLPPLFDFSMVPKRWQLCFLADCPHHGECLRYAVGQHVPDGVLMGPAVYPPAHRGDGCVYFKEIRVIRAAYGFDTLFADVKQKDYTPLHNSIKKYLGGHGTYYRYQIGTYKLTPRQQDDILAIFRQYGYTEDLHFDHYTEVIDFTHEVQEG